MATRRNPGPNLLTLAALAAIGWLLLQRRPDSLGPGSIIKVPGPGNGSRIPMPPSGQCPANYYAEGGYCIARRAVAL